VNDDFTDFGSRLYWAFMGLLVFARAMDLLSTWVATPNLILEANPIAKKIGWKGGIALNLTLCGAFALWPLPAIIIATTSILVAARNFQSAWLMRSLGEDRYRSWIAEQMSRTSLGLFLFCLLAQALLIGAVGAALLNFSSYPSWLPVNLGVETGVAKSERVLLVIPFGIGMGIVTYALAVAFFTLLSLWRLRRSMR
jgi:hypothetical protein